VRFIDLLWFFPLAFAVSVVLGAAGRRRPREILEAAGQTFRTLVVVVGGVALTIRLLILFFV
jgi:hypothetical protein